MDLATRKKQGIERQTTFGPAAPITEWELEKAAIFRELTENRERADRLQQKLEQDQLAFERNTTSLLKEVKLKEASWEKRRQETDASWMNQILELQQQLEKERQDHEDAIRDTKQQMDHTLQLEQKKYDRRMASLHSRLEEKEKVLQQYHSPSQELPSAVLPSPVTPSTSAGFDQALPSSVTTSSQKSTHDHLRQIQRLEQQLIKQRRRNDQLERQLEYQQPIGTIGENRSSTSWETERQELETMYNKKIQTLIESHRQELQLLRDNFMNENSELTMHMEARLQNTQNEYENTIHEIREEFATEKKVWSIEQQTTIDQLKRQLEQHYMDQQRENERIWRDKLNDMDASLSKDDTQVRTYWQMKIDTLMEAHNKERGRLLGELDVVKDRLGRDIDRRHRVQAELTALESKYNRDRVLWAKQRRHLEELTALKTSMEKATQEYQNAKSLAVTLLSTLSLEQHVTPSENMSTSLVDLLHLSLRKATLSQVKNTNDERVPFDLYDDTFGNIF